MLLLLSKNWVSAQTELHWLHIYQSDGWSKVLRVSDSLEAIKIVQQKVETYRTSGHLSAGLDSLRTSSDTLCAWLFKGPFLHVSRNLDIQQQLKRLENNGYPFATYRVNITRVDSFTVQQQIDSGDFIRYGNVSLLNKSVLNAKFTEAYLNLKPGKTYSERDIARIEGKLKRLRCVDLVAPPKVYFVNNACTVELYLKERRVNQVDGILALSSKQLPSGNQTIQLTGEANLVWYNFAHRGDKVELAFRSLDGTSKELKSAINFPYLLNKPIGFDGAFNLFRRDTTYSEVKWDLGIDYLEQAGNYVRGLVSGQQLLQADKSINTLRYGLALRFDRTEKLIYPRKNGWVSADYSTGFAVSGSNRYPRMWVNVEGEGMITRGRNTTNLRAEYRLVGGEQVSSAEWLRFGGYQTFRGFDEGFFSVRKRWSAKLEQRYYLEEESFAFVFVQYGMQWAAKTNTLLSLGPGVTLRLKPGYFTACLAVGKIDSGSFQLRVHLGLKYIL